MATKSELFVIAINSENNNTKYVGINAETNNLLFVENPIEIKRCFTHEDAHKVKQLMKETKDFLKEGESVRVKAQTQCLRDYCGELLKRGLNDVVIAGDETINGLIEKENLVGKVKESKEEQVKAEAETSEEEVKSEEPKKKSSSKKKAKKESETPVEEA